MRGMIRFPGVSVIVLCLKKSYNVKEMHDGNKMKNCHLLSHVFVVRSVSTLYRELPTLFVILASPKSA